MKNKKVLYIGFIAFIILLIAANGYLIDQNKAFKEENRKLLLQNDSLQSVNLMLLNTIDTVTKQFKTSTALNGKLTLR